MSQEVQTDPPPTHSYSPISGARVALDTAVALRAIIAFKKKSLFRPRFLPKMPLGRDSEARPPWVPQAASGICARPPLYQRAAVHRMKTNDEIPQTMLRWIICLLERFTFASLAFSFRPALYPELVDDRGLAVAN